jgi:hypothetical protein
MLTKNRIALIRLSKKLDDTPSYAQQIGVSVEYRKTRDQLTDQRKNMAKNLVGKISI